MPNKSDIEYDVDLNLKEFNKHKKQLDDSFKKTQTQVNKSSKAMNKSFGSIVPSIGAVTAGVGLVTAGLVAMTGAMTKVVEESGQLEKTTIEWKNITGSVQEAKDIIEDTIKFSNATPFTFKDIDEARKTIYNLSDGVLSSIDDIKLLGDVSAKSGQNIDELAVTYGRLYAKISAGDKAFGDEINRMVEIGAVSFDTGKKLKEMTSRELIGDGISTLNKDLAKAKGLMEELSSTLTGKMSTLESVFDSLFALDGENLESSKESLDGIIKLLTDNKDVIQDFFSFSLEVFNIGVNGALKSLRGYMSYVNTVRNQGSAGAKVIAEEEKVRGMSNEFLSREIIRLESDLKRFSDANVKATRQGILMKKLAPLYETTQNIRSESGAKSLKPMKEMIFEVMKEAFSGSLGANYKEFVRMFPEVKDELDNQIQLEKTNHRINMELMTLKNENSRREQSQIEKNIKAQQAETKKEQERKKKDIERAKKLKEANEKAEREAEKKAGDGFTPEELAGISPYLASEKEKSDEIKKVSQASSKATEWEEGLAQAKSDSDKEREAIRLEIRREEERLLQVEEERKRQESLDRIYGADMIVQTTESSFNQMVNIHRMMAEDFDKHSIKYLSQIGGTLTSGLSGVLKGGQQAGLFGDLGNLIPGLGLATSAFSLLGSVGDFFFGDDDEDSLSNSEIASQNAEGKADIVSSAIDTLIVNSNMNIYSAYVDTASFDELYANEIATRITETIQGVY